MAGFIATTLVIVVAAIWLAVVAKPRREPKGRHHWGTTQGQPVSAVMLTIALRREHTLRLNTRSALS